MIFQRSLIRELTQVAMAVFTVLLAIVLTTQVLKLFGRAAGCWLLTPSFAMVGFATLGSFGVVLSLTLFISIMIVLTRLHRDSEMAVWQTRRLVADRVDQPGAEICRAAGGAGGGGQPVSGAVGQGERQSVCQPP